MDSNEMKPSPTYPNTVMELRREYPPETITIVTDKSLMYILKVLLDAGVITTVERCWTEPTCTDDPSTEE